MFRPVAPVGSTVAEAKLVTQVTGALGPGTDDSALPAAALPGTAPAGGAPAGTAVEAGATDRRSARPIARSLFLLTKPRILELLLVTTLPTMLLADRGVPPTRLILVTLIGGALAAASANTLNCYLDRDIDAVMRRTSGPPLVARVSSPGGAGPAQGPPFPPGGALARGGRGRGCWHDRHLLVPDGGGDAAADAVRRLGLRLRRGYPRGLVPGRSAPAARPDR